MDKLQCSDSLAIPQPVGKYLTPTDYIGTGANGVVLKVSDESNNITALKLVPAIVRPNEDNAGRIRREEQFYQYLAEAEITSNLAKPIAWWPMENVEKADYLKWNKALRKRLNVEALDPPSRLVKETPGVFKLCVHFVQMEYYASGNLKTWLQYNSDKCQETYALRIRYFRDLLSAVDFLHSRDLMHRDICPNNIFLANDNERLHAVLGDFDSIVSCGQQALWPLTKARETFTSVMGTDPYAAPEIPEGNYDNRCDLYSLGVIALNLFFNVLDVNGLHSVIYKIHEKNVYPTCIFGTFWLDVLKSQLSRTPERRLSCQLVEKLIEKVETGRKQSLYLLQFDTNAFIALKDIRFGSASLSSHPSFFSQDCWENLPPKPKPNLRWVSVAACAGKMYAIGGTESSLTHSLLTQEGSNIVQQYNTQTGWQDWPSMLEDRSGCGATTLGGRLFVVGGCNKYGSQLSSAEECDLETGRWAHVTPMTIVRYGLGVAALDNLLFVVGGLYNSSVEWYDPRAGRWTKAASMHESRFYCGCAALGDRLYVAGGWAGKWMASMERFDLRTGRWMRVRDMCAPRGYFALAALNGQLLAAGGDSIERKRLDTVEVYDEMRDAWSTLDVRLPCGGRCTGCVLEE